MSNVIRFRKPRIDVRSVVDGLRELADDIEAGHEVAHNMVWVMDRGGGTVEVGMVSPTDEPGAVAHLYLAMGMRTLETLNDGISSPPTVP
jgi:hypothetical protein